MLSLLCVSLTLNLNVLKCRQKTRDFAAECKNMQKDKLCPIKFCHKCLLNRLDVIISLQMSDSNLLFSVCYEEQSSLLQYAILIISNLGMVKRQRRLEFCRTGVVQSAEEFATAASACKSVLLFIFYFLFFLTCLLGFALMYLCNVQEETRSPPYWYTCTCSQAKWVFICFSNAAGKGAYDLL